MSFSNAQTDCCSFRPDFIAGSDISTLQHFSKYGHLRHDKVTSSFIFAATAAGTFSSTLSDLQDTDSPPASEITATGEAFLTGILLCFKATLALGQTLTYYEIQQS